MAQGDLVGHVTSQTYRILNFGVGSVRLDSIFMREDSLLVLY